MVGCADSPPPRRVYLGHGSPLAVVHGHVLGALNQHLEVTLSLLLLRVAVHNDTSPPLVHTCDAYQSTGSAQMGVGGVGAQTAVEREGEMPCAEMGMEAGGSGMTRAVRGSMPRAKAGRAGYARPGGGGESPTASVG